MTKGLNFAFHTWQALRAEHESRHRRRAAVPPCDKARPCASGQAPAQGRAIYVGADDADLPFFQKKEKIDVLFGMGIPFFPSGFPARKLLLR